MIYDKLEYVSKYRGISQNLDKAIDWLQNNSVDTLPLGRTEIDGESVFVNVMNAQTRSQQEAQFEVHEKYMDLQINLQGEERFATGDKTCDVTPETDVSLCQGKVQTEGNLGAGWFALFLAKEPHMPTLNPADTAVGVKKVVFKILSDI